ncbi:MAG: TIGR03084 family metal-binding protein [Rhodospirillales bacterium]|nr:TIGR03084 family metal-binding protein [Rhodospirillales bacterium]
MMSQANDFREECNAVAELLAPMSDVDFKRPTGFKAWTINHIMQHLHFFNVMADLSFHDEPRFVREYGEMRAARETHGETLIDATDRLMEGLKGRALFEEWRAYYPGMCDRFAVADPKKRVKWAGPDMSVRSSITARLMETWSHTQAIYDLLGEDRINGDRIKNICVMGINTFDWTFINRDEPVPEGKPYVRLTAPSGALWEWNDASNTNRIDGPAEGFCRVVTQTRNIADTDLTVIGDVANRWMAVAQCFAGPPRTPPAPGTRRKA